MKKAILTTIIFFTFFSGTPKEIDIPVPKVYPTEELEVIIKLNELDSLVHSAIKALDEKDK